MQKLTLTSARLPTAAHQEAQGDGGGDETLKRDRDPRQDLLVRLALTLSECQSDPKVEHVREGQATLRDLYVQARQLQRTLQLTLCPWFRDANAERIALANAMKPYRDRYLSPDNAQAMRQIMDTPPQVWVRASQDENHSYTVAISGSDLTGWEFSAPWLGTFHGDRLDTVQAVADLMARLKGFRMVDESPSSVESALQVMVPSSSPTATSLPQRGGRP